MGAIDYFIDRIGPSVLAGSIVGCIISGSMGPVHFLLTGIGAALVIAGWWRVGRFERH
jgi:hypothetical protein